MNFQAWKMKFLNSISLRKQPSLRDARGGFPAKKHLRNEDRYCILMMCHYQIWEALLIG